MEDKLITFKSWNGTNIYRISDLYKPDGEMLSYEEFRIRYGIRLDFLSYAGCVSSVKNYMRKQGFKVQNNVTAEVNIALKMIYSVSKGTQLYYKLLNKDNWQPKCCSKWTDKLGKDIPWDACFQKIKLKWLQMRIVHRIIPTNIVLKEMGIVECHNCTFCNNEKDSIEHFLWRCQGIQEFWKLLEDLFKENCEIAGSMALTEDVVLFGVDRDFTSDVTL
eukprot:TRINITY_DN51716_c0_g1_i2.p1 TRINITY_DN51716_c0_g1~~TRINITY_DN51716_c0_g1_i2.p1  ORF type:complete len:243 (-),score=15.00 TRINITY_DN51716_c0_g1_i2:23-679(-)